MFLSIIAEMLNFVFVEVDKKSQKDCMKPQKSVFFATK